MERCSCSAFGCVAARGTRDTGCGGDWSRAAAMRGRADAYPKRRGTSRRVATGRGRSRIATAPRATGPPDSQQNRIENASRAIIRITRPKEYRRMMKLGVTSVGILNTFNFCQKHEE